MMPEEFKKRSNVAQLSVFLIKIKLEAYYANDIKIKSLYEFENRQFVFGIVTAADLDKVPDFLLFSRDGNFRVHLEKVQLYLGDDDNNPISISEDMLLKIKRFQSLLFSKDPQLMHFSHPVLNESSTDESYYIAPLKRNANGKLVLALDIIKNLEKFQQVNYNEELTMADRRKMKFSADRFSDALVIPCYSPSYNKKQAFCVVGIDWDRTPKSPFDDTTKARSFAEYYSDKHDYVIVNQDDPLVLAKPISTQLNYLVAKHEVWKMSRDERRDSKHSSSVVSIISELMRIHLSATLFVQSKLLPSIIHRIQRLLLAHEIQSSVNEFRLQQLRLEIRIPSSNAMRNEEDLQMLNQFVRDKAEISLLGSEILPPNVSKTGCSEVKSQSMSAYTLRRKLHWVEIEYIHPKNIQRQDLADPAYCGDEDDIEIESVPQSPPTSARTGITLIPSDEVPFENFDEIQVFEQPLLSSIMEALTLSNGRDFQDLEKLELIGDSVLKLIVTLHAYTHFPHFTEGQLTSLRTKLICNKHLYIIGDKKKLGEYLAGSLFEPETCWLPPGQTIPENLTKIAIDNDVNLNVFCPLEINNQKESIDFSSTTNELNETVKYRVENFKEEIQKQGPMHTSYTHSRIGDKSVADCVEALIGAYYLAGGLSGSLTLMNWLGLRGPTNEKPVTEIHYQNIQDLPRIGCEYPSEKQSFIPEMFVTQLEELLDYRFKNKWYLVEAFTHPSYTKNGSTNAYQRLEFLGDAVLDFLITHVCYKYCKQKITAGLLTDLRSALVNNVTFGSQAVRYDLHKLLLHFSPKLEEGIDIFVNCQERNKHQVNGAFQYLTDNDCVCAEDIMVPKALGDIFESLAGAVFLDSGMSLDTVWKVFYRLMKNEIDEFSEKIPKQPIRNLHERFPKGIKFDVINEKEDESRFLVQLKIAGKKEFFGCGITKKSAKLAAAKYAIKYLQDEEMKRKQYE